MLGIVFREFLDALLAAARDANDGETPLVVEGDERLHAELVAYHGYALGDAAASMERLEVVYHEDGLGVVAVFFGPRDELLGCDAGLDAMNRLLYKHGHRGGGEAGVYDVQGDVCAKLLAQTLTDGHRAVVAARNAA